MHIPRKPKIEPAVYSVPEVAALLEINLPKAYELARQPGFPAIRIGRRIVVPKEAFHRWLEQVALDKQSYDIAGN
jgi:excisionase family DNA binding protein